MDHEGKLSASGLTAKAYAAEHSLSLNAFYQSRKRLRELGLIKPTRAVHREKQNREAKSMAFSKVEVASPGRSSLDFRISLPNGVVLEWSGGALPSLVIELVERLTQSR